MPIEDHPLRLLRLRAGVGQLELARRAGLNRSTVSAIEEGRTATPSPATVAAIATVLHVSPGQLQNELNRWAARPGSPTRALTPKARAVLNAGVDHLARYESFAAWRSQIAPSVTAFASLLGVNRAVVSRYEDGLRVYGMPDKLASALLAVLGVSPAYLMALEELPVGKPDDDEEE